MLEMKVSLTLFQEGILRERPHIQASTLRQAGKIDLLFLTLGLPQDHLNLSESFSSYYKLLLRILGFV